MENSRKAGYAILLAGGKSSRMRQDKALLTLSSGRTLLDHQKQLLSHVSDNVLVSRDDNAKDHIPDTFKNSGPLAGIHAALTYIANHDNHTKDAIIIPVDMPLITPDLIGQLVKYGNEFNLPCHFRDTNLPIYLPDINHALPRLEKLLSNDQRIVNTFLDAIRAKSLVCHEPDKIANANTPMQWKLLKRSIEA